MSELVAKPIGANIPPEISDRLERLELLYTLSLDIFGARNIDELLTVVMSRVTKAMKADRSTLFIVDQERRVIWSKVAQGTEPFTVPMGRGISGYVAQTGETLNIPDAYQDERFNPEVDRRTGYKTNSILCMPVKDREGVVIAVIQAINKLDGIFSEQDSGTWPRRPLTKRMASLSTNSVRGPSSCVR